MHDNYKQKLYDWRLVRDAIAGESCIKRQNELYLPMPSAMRAAPGPDSSIQSYNANSASVDAYYNNPNYHPVAAYQSYKTRAAFPEITGFFLRGLLGIATRKPPMLELSPVFEYLGVGQRALGRIFTTTISELLQVGRHILAIDVDADGDPIILSYNAESLTDWACGHDEYGNEVIEYACLEEPSYYIDTDGERCECMNKRILTLDSAGLYICQKYDHEGALLSTEQPLIDGKPLHYVPIVIIGSTGVSAKIDISPLQPIASTAIHIYMKNADISQSEFLSASPTLIFSGMQRDEVPGVVGSGTAIALPNPAARGYYTTTDTSALQHLLNHVAQLYDQASAYGANLLGGTKKAAESGEALRLRQASAGATLVTVVQSAEQGIREALRIISEWTDMDGLVFAAQTEFADVQLTAPDMAALLQAWMGGAISHHTYLDNLRRGGVLGGDSVETEIDRIESAPPKVVQGGQF